MISDAPGFQCRFDPAQPGEGRSIARAIRLSLPPHLRRFTIWASPAAGRYVESLLAGSNSGEQREHYLLRCSGRIAGLAVFRDVEGRAFLNHLYMSPQWRGRSLGAWLLTQAARWYLERYSDLERHPVRQVALDVFSGSHPAEAWYERLGFRETEKHGWWIAQNVVRPTVRQQIARRHASVLGFRIEAIRKPEAWGFHQFICVLPGGRRYEVGCLYGPYFRLSDPRAAADNELHRALASLDPKRRLLLVASGDFSDSNWKCIAVSRRLACNASPLLDHLQSPAAAEAAYRRTAPAMATFASRAGQTKWGAPSSLVAEVIPNV